MTLRSVFIAADGRLRASWRALAFLPSYLISSIAFSLSAAFIVGSGAVWQDPELALALAGLGSALAALFVAAVFLRLLDARDFRTLGLWSYSGWSRELGLGLLAGFLLISLVVALQWLLGGIAFRGLATHTEFWVLAAVWNLALLLPAAAGEELVFRGYPFQRLVEAWGQWPALVFLAAFFGAVHLENPSRTALSTFNTSLMGVLLGLAYLKTRGLWLPIGLHFAWNYSLGFLYSLPLSGLRLERVLWRVEGGGPGWISGGGYGPEGSLVCALIAIGAILFLAGSRRFQPSPPPPAAIQ